jgi:hypothetical protein
VLNPLSKFRGIVFATLFYLTLWLTALDSGQVRHPSLTAGRILAHLSLIGVGPSGV